MKLNLLLVCLLFSIIGFSQEKPIIIENESIRFKPFSAKNLPIAESLITKYGYYFIKVEKNKKEGRYTLYHYGHDLDLINSKEIIVSYNLNQRKILHFTLMNEKILVFESLVKPNKRTKLIRMSTYDPSSLENIGEPEIVFKSEYKGFLKKASRFHFSSSPNSKYLLICENNYKNKNNRELGVAILNEENEKIQIEKISVQNKKFYIIQNALISDVGEAFILHKRCLHTNSNFDYDYRNLRFHKLRKIKYFIHKITPKNKFATQIILESNIKELHMNFDLNQKPFFMGFDFHKKYKGVILIKTDGSNFDKKNLDYFYFDYSSNKDFSFLVSDPFSAKTLRLRNILQKPNGNFVIIGEEGYPITTGEDKKNFNKRNSNLIITEIHEEDGKEWSHLISKTNRSNYTYPSDFTLFNSKNDLYILHKDNIKKRPLTLTYIKKEGSIHKSTLIEGGYFISHRKNIKISDKEFLLFLYNNKHELELKKFKVEN